MNSVVEMKTVPDRLMRLKLKIRGVMLNVLSSSGWMANEKFWSKLDEVVESGVTSSPHRMDKTRNGFSFKRTWYGLEKKRLVYVTMIAGSFITRSWLP